MSFRRIMFLISVFLILIFPVVWFMAPLWLSKGAEYILAQQQCDEVVVNIEAVGWNKSKIKKLYCKGQQDAFEIDLTNAEISYNLAELMEKRIEHVSLESVALHLRSSSEAKAEAIPALTTPAILLEALPVSSFNIRNIVVQRYNLAGEMLQELKGYAHYADQRLSLELKEDSYLKGLQLKLEVDKKNGVSAALYQGKTSILHIESTIHKTADTLSMDGVLDITLAPFVTALKPWLNMPVQQLHGNLNGSWQLSLPTQGNKPLLQKLNASAALKLDFMLSRPDSGRSRGKVTLNLNYKQGGGVWSFSRRSQIDFGDKYKTGIDVSSLSGSFALAESGWSATVAKNSALQVKNIVMGDIRIPHVQIKNSRAVEITPSPKGSVEMVKKAVVTMVLPTLTWQGNSLASRNLKLIIDRGSLLAPSGSFVASAIKYTSPMLTLPESNISGTFHLSAQQITVTGKVDAEDSGIHLNWTLKHHLTRQKGELVFSSNPLRFGAAGIDLSRIVKNQADYAIDVGTLALDGRLEWQQPGQIKHKATLDTQLELKLSNLKGHYKTNVFSGLSGGLFLVGDQKKLLMAPTTITLNRLYAGVPVNNISMSVAFTYPFSGLASMEINQFTAEALGGQISSEKISIDLARASNPFVVQVKHLDAGKIADIRRQEGLQVKGLLDGNLPFNWTRDGLNMTTGELQATPAGGLIRYAGAESIQNSVSTNQATKMVLDIMNNFHYKHLKIGADYRSDGELKMRIHLKGNNPGYEKGRAIVLNFNIEENVLKLLQGIGMTGDISDAVEKKVQKKLQQ